MKIALINENSQAAKNGVIVETLKKVVEPLGHEVFNYGMYSADDAEQLTYVQIGILAAILLNSGAADLVITGCGTGEGACLACNAFPGVLCGHVVDPTDAYQFTQVNNGNCIAMPFAKGWGWGAELNLQYVFEKLFVEEWGGGYPKERAVPEQRNAKILNEVKNLLRVLLQVSNSKTCSSLTASAIRLPNTLKQLLINFALKQVCNAYLFFCLRIFILPPLRHFVTPLLKERLSKGSH